MGFFDRIRRIKGKEEQRKEQAQPRKMPEKKVGLGRKGTFIAKEKKEYKLTGAFEELARVGVPVGNFSVRINGQFYCMTDLGDHFARLMDKKDAFDSPIVIGSQRHTVQAYVSNINVSSHQIRIINHMGDYGASKIWTGEDDKVGLVQRINTPESDLVKVFGVDDNLIAGEIIAIRERDRRFFDTMFNGDQEEINKMMEKRASEGKIIGVGIDELVKKILGTYGADYVNRAKKVIEEAQNRYVLRGNYFIEIIDREDAENLEKGLYFDECSSTGGLLLLKSPDNGVIKDYIFDIQEEERKGMPIAYGGVSQIRRLVPLFSWREVELCEASSEEMRLECVYAYPAGEPTVVDTSKYPEAVWVIGDGALIETLRQSNSLVDTAKKKGAVEIPQYYFYMNIDLKELHTL